LLAASGAKQTVKTAGALTLAGGTGGSGRPSALRDGEDQIGGPLAFLGGTVSDATTVQALAGQGTPEAARQGGDVPAADTSRILASGKAQRFSDVVSVAAGGTVALIADAGNVATAAGSVIDVSAESDSALLALPQVASAANAGQIVFRAAGN